MRRCRKRKPSSSGNVGAVERMSSLRTSVVRCEPTSLRTAPGESSATAPRWKTSPSTAPRSMTRRTSPSSESMRAWRRAWIVGGTATSPAPPCSRTIASISSTNSGFPADAAVIRSRKDRVERAVPPPGAPSADALVLGERLEQKRASRSACLPPQPGLTSSSSVRAMHRRKIGASRERSATCSTRSMNTGSAHCRSSITTTCGRSAARASSSRRNASCVSGGELPMTSSGSTPIATRISTSGQ